MFKAVSVIVAFLSEMTKKIMILTLQIKCSAFKSLHRKHKIWSKICWNFLWKCRKKCTFVEYTVPKKKRKGKFSSKKYPTRRLTVLFFIFFIFFRIPCTRTIVILWVELGWTALLVAFFCLRQFLVQPSTIDSFSSGHNFGLSLTS